jgi:chromodomain-helicase-DNA-binding protein 1
MSMVESAATDLYNGDSLSSNHVSKGTDSRAELTHTQATEALTEVDFDEDPELYGLRRSRRAHVAPERFSVKDEPSRRRMYDDSDIDDDDDDDGDEFGSSRKSRKKGRGRAKIKTNDSYSDDYPMNDEDDDDEAFASSKRARAQEMSRIKKKRKLMRSRGSNEGSEVDSGYAAEMRFSTRNSKVVNYNIDVDDEDFEDQVTYKYEDGDDYAYAEAEPVREYKHFFCFLNFFFFERCFN